MRTSEIAGLLCVASFISFSLSAEQFDGQETIGVSVKNDERQIDSEKKMLAEEASKLLRTRYPLWVWRANAKGTVANLEIELVIGEPSETSYMMLTLRSVLDLGVFGCWRRDHLFPKKQMQMPQGGKWVMPFNNTLSVLLSSDDIARVLRKIPVCRDVDYPAGDPPWQGDVIGVISLKWPGDQVSVGSTAFGIKADDGTSETPIAAFATGHPRTFAKVQNAYPAVAVKITHVNTQPVSTYGRTFQGLKTKGVFWKGDTVSDPIAP